MLTPQVKKEHESLARLHKKVSVRRIDNPEESEKLDSMAFQLRGVTYHPKLKELTLSNRSVTDADILSHIGSVKHFPHLTAIELRHNRITELSCKLIGANLPHLLKVDIRGNKVGDNGVAAIARNISQLREYYICETGATDLSIDVILEHLKQLTLLWA